MEPRKTRCSRQCGSPSSGWCHAPSPAPPPLDSVARTMWREHIGSSVVTTSPRREVAGERYDDIAPAALPLSFSALPPRMRKGDVDVTLQFVPLFGPGWVETSTAVVVVVVVAEVVVVVSFIVVVGG